jgi:hypothetical protein
MSQGIIALELETVHQLLNNSSEATILIEVSSLQASKQSPTSGTEWVSCEEAASVVTARAPMAKDGGATAALARRGSAALGTLIALESIVTGEEEKEAVQRFDRRRSWR